jgi:hypothetical protein
VSQNQDLQQQQQQPSSHQQSPLFASGGDFGGGAVGAAIDGPEGGATATVSIDVEDPAISALPRVLLMGARRGGKTSIQVRCVLGLPELVVRPDTDILVDLM